MDIYIGDFVRVQALKSIQRNGKLLWVAKLKNFEMWQEKMESSWLFGSGQSNQKASAMDQM
jgi:hypothetical protein